MANKKDMSPLPIKAEGNGSNIVPFDIDIADLLMLQSAFAIARNTSMMDAGKESMQRLEYYRQEIEARLPDNVKNIRRGGALAEAIYAIRKNGWWSHTHKKRRTWDSRGETLVRSGDRTWSFNYSCEDKEHDQTIAAIRDLAPLTAEERPWEEDKS